MHSYHRHFEQCVVEVLQVLAREWDPLRTNENPDVAENYADYVGSLCNLLLLKKPLHTIMNYLWELETTVMGLAGNIAHTEEIARMLLVIAEKNSCQPLSLIRCV